MKLKNETAVKEINIAAVEKSNKLLSTTKMKVGQKLFKMNIKTHEISEVVFESEIDINNKKKKKLTIESDHIYMWALNIKNATRKIFNKYYKE